MPLYGTNPPFKDSIVLLSKDIRPPCAHAELIHAQRRVSRRHGMPTDGHHADGCGSLLRREGMAGRIRAPFPEALRPAAHHQEPIKGLSLSS
jgi:hypothetical protein